MIFRNLISALMIILFLRAARLFACIYSFHRWTIAFTALLDRCAIEFILLRTVSVHTMRSLATALGNVFAFDQRDKETRSSITEVMHKHGISLDAEDRGSVCFISCGCAVCVSTFYC